LPAAWRNFTFQIEDQQMKTRFSTMEKKECPECNHIFQGNGFDGIDAHWRSKHEHLMPYEKAWPLIRIGKWSAHPQYKE